MFKTTHRPSLAQWAALAALLGAAHSAHALDYSGYFRGGPGLTKKDASRACYALNTGSAGLKYRLGNECDIGGEFQLVQGFKKDGIDYSATLMVARFNSGTEPDGGGLAIEQMFFEGKGFDILPEATFWAGRQRGRRGDVHIVDTFFTDMVGTGAGVRGIGAGPGKLGVALYRKDTGTGSATQPTTRVNVEYVDIASNPNGKLNFFLTGTKGDFTGGTSGVGVSARHDQSNLFGTGLSNTLWVQYAQGSAGLNSNFGNSTFGSASKNWRIVESVSGQSGPLGGQAILLFAKEKNGAGQSTTSSTIGGRVSYALTKNFKLVSELGISQAKPDGGATQRLTKFTLAPTLSVGPDFWTRPELRLYVTTAKWNAAAGNVTGVAEFANKTSGTSYGAQVEWWF